MKHPARESVQAGVSDLLQHMEHLIRHDRRVYLRLCAWCDRQAGACDHARELMAQARARSRELRRPARVTWRPYVGPWVADRPGEVGLTLPEASRGVPLDGGRCAYVRRLSPPLRRAAG